MEEGKNKIEIGIQFIETVPIIEYKIESECCAHEFTSCKQESQHFRTCLNCGKIIWELPPYASTEF